MIKTLDHFLFPSATCCKKGNSGIMCVGGGGGVYKTFRQDWKDFKSSNFLYFFCMLICQTLFISFDMYVYINNLIFFRLQNGIYELNFPGWCKKHFILLIFFVLNCFDEDASLIKLMTYNWNWFVCRIFYDPSVEVDTPVILQRTLTPLYPWSMFPLCPLHQGHSQVSRNI